MTRILYVEDDEADRSAFERMVRLERLNYSVTLAATLREARAYLETGEFDVIVTDYHLPDGQGSELCDEVPDTPFVLVTGTLEEQLAIRTLERGADDYLVKTPDILHLRALPHTIEKTLIRHRLREFESRLVEALRESEERFRLLVEGVVDYAIIMLDPDGIVVSWNSGAERITGYAAQEIIGRNNDIFFSAHARNRGDPQRILERAVAEGTCRDEDWRVRKNGDRFIAEVTSTPLRGALGELRGFAKVMRDVTERKQAEEQSQANLERLHATNAELETFNRAMVGREKRMIELKGEINVLCAQLGQAPRYNLDLLEQDPVQSS